jgi:hypothetical protein
MKHDNELKEWIDIKEEIEEIQALMFACGYLRSEEVYYREQLDNLSSKKKRLILRFLKARTGKEIVLSGQDWDEA